MNDVENAFEILLKFSWEITKKETHQKDLPTKKERYNKIIDDFRLNPLSFIEDCVNDIKSLWD